jgi:hypothetical protein
MTAVTAIKDAVPFGNLADEASLQRTAKALEINGFEVFIVDSGEEAKAKVIELVPAGAEVMTNPSQTLDKLGLTAEFNDSGRYDPVRPKMMALYGDPAKKREMQKIAAAPDYSLGSVHAVTEDGQVIIASASGSQLSQIAYAAGKVIWVVGTQKIVHDVDAGLQRIREYTFPREDERAQAAYGFGSTIGKELIVRRDIPEKRSTIIFVRQNLGF